jgi:mono/diheme cytochrome c family protein
MRRWLKGAAVALLALLLLLALLVVGGRLWALKKRVRVVDVPAPALALAEGDAAVRRGRYLYESRGCSNCHGLDAAGRVYARSDDGVELAAPNLTPGGVVARYTGSDWTRAVRHGAAPGGRPLLMMPSEDYTRLSDGDLGAIVAYLRQRPAVPGGAASIRLPFIAWVAYGWGMLPDAPERVDHTLPAPRVSEAVSAEYGAYVAAMCVGCHGTRLEGGRVPGNPPQWPPAARLAPGPGSVLERYPDVESLRALFRTGRRPDGSAVAVMPFESLARLSELEVNALHLYLRGDRAPAVR